MPTSSDYVYHRCVRGAACPGYRAGYGHAHLRLRDDNHADDCTRELTEVERDGHACPCGSAWRRDADACLQS